MATGNASGLFSKKQYVANAEQRFIMKLCIGLCCECTRFAMFFNNSLMHSMMYLFRSIILSHIGMSLFFILLSIRARDVFPGQRVDPKSSFLIYPLCAINLSQKILNSDILGVIKGANHVTRWFTPLFAEREVCEPNSRISLYINFLYVLTNHQCSIFVAVFWLLNDYHSDYLLKAQPLSFLGYKGI